MAPSVQKFKSFLSLSRNPIDEHLNQHLICFLPRSEHLVFLIDLMVFIGNFLSINDAFVTLNNIIIEKGLSGSNYFPNPPLGDIKSTERFFEDALLYFTGNWFYA